MKIRENSEKIRGTPGGPLGTLYNPGAGIIRSYTRKLPMTSPDLSDDPPSLGVENVKIRANTEKIRGPPGPLKMQNINNLLKRRVR